MLLRTPDQTHPATPLIIEAAGQRYRQTTQFLCRQTTQFLYLGGIIHESADLSFEISRRIRLMWACFRRFGPELYNRTSAPLRLKIRMLKAEVIETLLYGCVTWTLCAKHFAKLRTAHHQVLLRVIGFHRRPDYTTLSYAKALKKEDALREHRNDHP